MSALIAIEATGRTLDIEYAYVGDNNPDAPLIVFLHEGLGSVAMWRDFPQRLCDRVGVRGLVYSRPGYGRSTPRRTDEHWAVDFMHIEARDVLPSLLHALNIDSPAWLFGHSDGGSIALIHAAMFPNNVSGVIALAPHLFVEDVSVKSIEKTRETYLTPPPKALAESSPTASFKSKLARFHNDVDSAFWGWNDIWLDPTFRAWNIESLLPHIRCPVLAIQGVDDEYGTMAQIDRIALAVPNTQLVALDRCGHSPHRDQPDAVIDAVIDAVQKIITERPPQ